MFVPSHLVCIAIALMAIGEVKAFDATRVTNMIQTSYECHQSNPALAVAVVKNGQILYSRGFGVTNLKTKKQVTDDTLFGIASVTKSFTAALFLKLLHEKTNLTVDSKVREFYGDDFVMPDAERTNEMTFLDMLSHKTAMLSNNKVRLDDKFDRKSILKRLRLFPSPSQFRVKYIYSNLMYGLLARTSEILGGETEWEKLITDHLFKPLGMDKSTFATKIDFEREDLARGYSELDGPGILEPTSEEVSRIWGGMCGSGSIISNVKEISKWMNFHLSGGNNSNGDQVLDKKLLDEQHTGRFHLSSPNYLGIEQPVFPITVGESAYALGLRVGHYRGYPLVAHTGGTYGYKAYMLMLPTQNIGVIVLMTGTDSSYRQRAPVAHYLMDSALGVEPYINETTICTFPNPWVSKEVKTTYRPNRTENDAPLQFKTEQYEDTFSHNAYGDITIKHNSTLQSLDMSLGWGRWQMLVMPQTKGTQEQQFYLKGIEPNFAPEIKPVSFITHPEKDNVIIGLRATGFEKNLPPIFCKSLYKDICGDLLEKSLSQTKRDSNIYSCPSNAMSYYVGAAQVQLVMFALIFAWFVF